MKHTKIISCYFLSLLLSLSLSLRIAEIIEKSKEVNVKDKETLRALINEAKDSVTYIDEDNREGN